MMRLLCTAVLLILGLALAFPYTPAQAADCHPFPANQAIPFAADSILTVAPEPMPRSTGPAARLEILDPSILPPGLTLQGTTPFNSIQFLLSSGGGTRMPTIEFYKSSTLLWTITIPIPAGRPTLTPALPTGGADTVKLFAKGADVFLSLACAYQLQGID